MDVTTKPIRLATLVLGATAALAAAACAGGDAGFDKAGGSGAPVVLRLANPYGGLDQTPAVEYFVEHAEELSGGRLRIEAADRWAEFSADAEQQVVRDVANNEVDLGWVGTRVFDILGVESFQALGAPMLIDSYALQSAVIESGITDEMMEGMDDLGVVGLGVVPDGLRKPVGVSGPLLSPEDWRGVGFGTLPSKGQAEAIRALGATPAQLFGPAREEAFDNGTIQGVELGMWIYRDPKWPHRAPYVTSNVTLWPQMNVLLANPARLGALTAEQRGWIEEAARDAADRSDDLADKEADAVATACASGARFADAAAADLAALRTAFASVYANLEQQPETRAFIDRIRALKESTPSGPRLSIPSDCTGKAPAQAIGDTRPGAANVNGTYRYVITLDDARKADMVDPEETYPSVTTVILDEGDLEGGCFGSGGGSYTVEDDRITFHSVEYGYDLTASFARDDEGNLRFTPVPPSDPGDAFWCFSQVWTKIG
jgi:TRAP-type C4-dicarboxylate transport system substrate-binding protein